MSDFDRDELICDIWDRHSDSDGLMDIMGARKFAIDLLSSAPNHPSPAEPDKEAVRNAALEEVFKMVEDMDSYSDKERFRRALLQKVKDMKSQPTQPTLNDSIAHGINEAISSGDGFWRSCTGCHELNEGHATGPYSKIFKCHLGGGCHECGGIGAIWDDTDYAEMGDAMTKSMAEQTAQPIEGESNAS